MVMDTINIMPNYIEAIDAGLAEYWRNEKNMRDNIRSQYKIQIQWILCYLRPHIHAMLTINAIRHRYIRSLSARRLALLRPLPLAANL